MNRTFKCHRCYTPMSTDASLCSACFFDPPGTIEQMHLAVILRFSNIVRWCLFASAPSVVVLALRDLPRSLAALNYVAVQGFVCLRFNGRLAAVRRRRTPSEDSGVALLPARAFYLDTLSVSLSVLVAALSYLQLAKVLLAQP